MICRFDQLRSYRQRVTLVDGSFDPLHPGHLEYFQKAKAFGLPLVCNISPDSYTATKHPILIPAADRAQILDALRLIDVVHVAEGPTHEVLRELQPAIYAKGDGWAGKLPKAEIDVCQARNIAIKFTGRASQSSSALLRQFQPDVDAFERLVQSQTPAVKPWEPTAAVPYDFESRKAAEGIHPELIRDVFRPSLRVMDAGCGPQCYLVRLLRNLNMCPVDGIDTQVAASYSTMGSVKCRDLADPLCCDYEAGGVPHHSYELVICREVLEHLTLRQIREAVRNLCLMSDRFVYLTTRFSQARHFLDFATSDGLDPTHISIMPQAWLRHLFVLEGFRRCADLEQTMDHKKLGRVLVYERV